MFIVFLLKKYLYCIIKGSKTYIIQSKMRNLTQNNMIVKYIKTYIIQSKTYEYKNFLRIILYRNNKYEGYI